jgi:hypothetical protein
LALTRDACLCSIAEYSIIASAIVSALGDETCIACFEADFTCTCIAWGRAGQARAHVACLHAVTELAVIAVGIVGARDLFAYVVIFTAEKTYTTRPCAVLALIRDACLRTIAEDVIIAVGIVGARGVNLAYSVCWITLLTNLTLHGYTSATGI